MATTLYLYRVTLAMPETALVPEGSSTELAAWLNAQLGKDTVWPDLGPGLSASGVVPVTHHWCSTGWMEADTRSMLGHLADLGGISRPSTPQWNGWTMEQKCAWANDTLHPAVNGRAGGGVQMVEASVDGSAPELLARMGLMPTYIEPPPM